MKGDRQKGWRDILYHLSRGAYYGSHCDDPSRSAVDFNVQDMYDKQSTL